MKQKRRPEGKAPWEVPIQSEMSERGIAAALGISLNDIDLRPRDKDKFILSEQSSFVYSDRGHVNDLNLELRRVSSYNDKQLKEALRRTEPPKEDKKIPLTPQGKKPSERLLAKSASFEVKSIKHLRKAG